MTLNQQALNKIFLTLLESAIAEDTDLPCKSASLMASALLSLSQHCDCKLDSEQLKILNQQLDYV